MSKQSDLTVNKVKVYTPEEFVAFYNKLCQETGYTIQAHPEWKFRDDATFSVVVVMTVEKLPEKK